MLLAKGPVVRMCDIRVFLRVAVLSTVEPTRKFVAAGV